MPEHMPFSEVVIYAVFVVVAAALFLHWISQQKKPATRSYIVYESAHDAQRRRELEKTNI